MEKTEIESRVKKVIASVLKVDPNKLQPETNFILDLGADSNQSTQLVCAFEEEFGIELELEKAMEVQNVGGAVEFISSLVNG